VLKVSTSSNDGSPPCVLTINSGSSSIRFAVFEAREPRRRVLGGKVDRIGVNGTTLIVDSPDRAAADRHAINATNHHAAAGVLLDWLEAQLIVEDDAQEGTVDRQTAVVLDEPELAKLVHEEIHA
jgi:acetate kinase